MGETAAKILYVSAAGGFYGGVERYIYDTAGALQRHGYRVFGLFERRERDWPEFAAVFEETGTMTDAAAMLRAHRFDLIYLHKTDDPELVAQLRQHAPVAVFIHDHDYYCPRRHKYYPLTRKNCTRAFNMLYCAMCSAMIEKRNGRIVPIDMVRKRRLLREIRACDRGVVMSEFMRGNLLMNGWPAEKIVKLYPLCRPAAAAPETERKTGTTAPTIVYVGQLIRGKGVDLLLRALARLDLPFRAVIVGSNNDEAFLRQLVQQLGLTERVDFAGWQAEPARFWREAAVAVFPSRWQEPFGMTGIEAFSQGVPVAGFAVGGVTEWLQDGVNGLAVPPGDDAALAAAIRQLLTAPATAAAMGRAGQRLVTERFGEENFMTGFKTMLAGLGHGKMGADQANG
ncbi:MAG: glycosyltransferase family 4 protein [Victivallales bacterium]|nr:glycosyltransferase family 4 protein [Victivallales bacterium]